MAKSNTKKQTKGLLEKQVQRSNPMIVGGSLLALASIALLAFVIKTKIF